MDRNSDDTNWTFVVAVIIAVAVVLVCIAIFALPENPAAYSAADENITGPPTMTFLPPLWIVSVAGVLAGGIGVAIAAYNKAIE